MNSSEILTKKPHTILTLNLLEFLQSQIEVGTPVCASLQQAHAELRHLRQSVAEVARAHDLTTIAASTHPFARPQDQVITKKARYAELALNSGVRRLRKYSW